MLGIGIFEGDDMKWGWKGVLGRFDTILVTALSMFCFGRQNSRGCFA